MAAKASKTPSAKPKKKKKNPNCPFLFFGYAPADYNAGPFIYEARFKQPINEMQVEYAARGFEYSITDSAVEAVGHNWQWSGPWIAMRVEPAAGCDVSEMHADMRMFFQVFEAWGLEEVVFHGVRAPGSETWDALTIEQQPEPSPAPRWRDWDLGQSYYGAKQTRLDLETRVDETFEAFRATYHKPRQVAAPGQPALVRAKPCEAKDAVPPADRALLPEGFHQMLRAGGRTWAGVRTGNDGDLWWIDDGRASSVHVPGFDKFSVSEDGKRAFAISYDEVHEIVPPAVELPAPLFAMGDRAVVGAGYGADGTIALLDTGTLRLFSREGLLELERVDVTHATSLGVFRGGTIAVVTCGGGIGVDGLVRVFRISNQRFTEVASFKRDGVDSFTLDGKIYVGTLKGVRELVNV